MNRSLSFRRNAGRALQAALVYGALLGAAHAQTCPANHQRVAPDSRYTVSEPGSAGEAVVLDTVTGLMWKACPQGLTGAACATGTLQTLTWSAALVNAEAETFAGFGDWRLPNIAELASLHESGCHSPAINASRFPGSVLSLYSQEFWSSTSSMRPTSLQTAFAFRFNGLTPQTETFKTGSLPVRLVRRGNGFDAYRAGGDAVPAAFSIPAQGGVAPGQPIASAAVGVSGIDVPTAITVSGAPDAAYAINGGAFTSRPGAVSGSDQVVVRHTSSGASLGVVTSTLTLGGVSADFVTTTRDSSPPGAPTGVAAVAGNASATLSFSAPASAGGTPITGYAAASTPAGGIGNCVVATLSCSVTGLTNGVSYTFTVTASNDGGAGPASGASNAVTPQAPQTITFGPLQNRVFGAVPFTVSASSDSGLDVAIASQTASVCSIDAQNLVSVQAAGTCTLRATQAGNAAYTAATPVDASFAIAKAAQTISFTAPASATLAGGPFAVTVGGGGSGNPVIMTSQTASICSVAGSTVTPLALGTCTLRAEQAGSDNYEAAPAVERNVEVGTNSAPTIALGFGSVLSIPENNIIFGSYVFAMECHRLILDDVETTRASLVVTVDVDNQSLLSPANVSIERQSLAAEICPTPELHAHGTVNLTYTVTDGDGASASLVVPITVEPRNSPPTASYARAVRLPASAAEGPYIVPGFVLSSNAGAPDESGQSITHRVNLSFDFGSRQYEPSIRDLSTVDDELRFTLDYPSDSPVNMIEMNLRVVAQDSGAGDGECNMNFFYSAISFSGTDTRCAVDETEIAVVVGDAYAATVDLTRTAVAVTKRPLGVEKALADPIAYRIAVINVGSLPFSGARVTAAIPAGLRNATWTCTTPTGACSPASGSGPVNTLVALDLDEVAVIRLQANVAETATHVTLSAQVDLPNGGTGVPVEGDVSARFDVVSEDFVHFDGFE